MGKILEKFNIDECCNAMYDFFIKYKSIILITFFIGVAVNAVDVFTIKFGIDSEIYAMLNSPKIYFDTQRYGSWLLYYLLPFARYHIISQLIGIFVLTMAALLSISRHNISNNAKLLFMVLFVTYPNFAFLQYFYFQSIYNFIGLLFTVIAYRLIEKNNIIAYIFAVILLLIGISSYQANAAVYLSVMMINITLDYINSKNILNSIKLIIKYILFLIVVLILYYVLIKVIGNNFSSYHSDFIRHNSNYFDNISSMFTYMYRILISYHDNAKHTANIIITVLMAISLIYLLLKYYKEKYYLFLILMMIGCVLSFFSMNIVIGGFIPVRAELALAFYPAFILLIIFILNKNRKLQIFVIILTILIAGYHTTYIVKYQTSYYMAYKQDEIKAIILMEKIYNKYPEINNGKYNLYITGVIDSNYKHPLVVGKDMLGVSFFSYTGGVQERILAFMKLFGFPMDVKLGKITDNMKKEIKTMPSYPSNDCVKLIDDTVVVKLSD